MHHGHDGETPDPAESPASAGAAGKKKPNRLGLGFKFGGDGQNRTADLWVMNPSL